MQFLTPTVLKAGGRAVRAPEFGALWRAVQLRLSELRLAHGEGRPNINFRQAIHRAEAVPLAHWEGEQVAWERFSRRQDRRVPMGGLVDRAI